MASVRKRPDIIVMLAVLIGTGVLVTELAFGDYVKERTVESRY